MTSWERAPGMHAVDADRVEDLGRHWEDGWNRQDVDVIMEPFADDVAFRSPFVSRIADDEGRTVIEGLDAVRRYVADSFVRAPGIRYTLDSAYASTESVVLLYTVHHPTAGDRPGADYMGLDADGRIVDWRSHYPFER